MAKKSKPQKLNPHTAKVAAAAAEARLGAVDVIGVAYEGLADQDDWDDDRKARGFNALIRMIRATFTRDHKRLGGKRRLLVDHTSDLPDQVVEAVTDADKAYDKASEARKAKKATATRKAKRPTPAQVAQAAQGNADPDDDTAPDQGAVAKVKPILRLAQRLGQTKAAA